LILRWRRFNIEARTTHNSGGTAMANLPASNVKRLLGTSAGDIRISAEAVTKGVEAAEAYLAKLGETAASIARGHGRKTIMPEDLDAALRG
jgi:histone H3/H4